MKSLFFTVIVLITAVSGALAQLPEERVVVGASTGWFPGAHLGYNINDKFQLAVQLGLRSVGKSEQASLADGNTYITICLSGKYFLTNSDDFNAYGLGVFYINPATMSGLNASGHNQGIALGAGAEYFPSKNVGLFAQLAVLRLPFDDKTDALHLGLLTPSVGIEWFLNLD